MKNTFIKILSLGIIFIFLLSVFSFNTFAAGTVISFSKNKVDKGDTVTVTVSINPDETMSEAKCSVNYDSDIFEFTSGDAEGGAGVVKISQSVENKNYVSYDLKFTAIAPGSCMISVTDCSYTSVSPNGSKEKGITGCAASLTVIDKELSDNADLKSLKISEGSLSPKFSPDVTEYEVKVKNDVTELFITAVTSDKSAKVSSVSGDDKLAVGKNERIITVTSADGNKKEYTLNIYRAEDEEAANGSDENNDSEENENFDKEPNNYKVASDISSVKLFNGFKVETAEFQGKTVQVARDKNGVYTIYYLSVDGSKELLPYTLNEETNSFERLAYLTQGNNTYIISTIPQDKTVPKDYSFSTANVNGFDVNCLVSNNADLSDFVFLYCFDEDFSFYRYDTIEKVIQRSPEIELLDSAQAEDIQDNQEAVSNRFDMLSTNGKIILICLALILIGTIALIVLLIVRSINNRRAYPIDDYYSDENGFDDITLNGLMFDEENDEDNSDK